jgi:hypothetical protein
MSGTKQSRIRTCPRCNRQVTDSKVMFCPYCGVNLHVPHSAMQHGKGRKGKKSTRILAILVTAVLLVLAVMLCRGIASVLKGPEVGDLCYPDNPLCSKPLCGGEFIWVEPYQQCKVVQVDDRYGGSWILLACSDGRGWDDGCAKSPRP